jgi:hypothetical protein
MTLCSRLWLLWLDGSLNISGRYLNMNLCLTRGHRVRWMLKLYRRTKLGHKLPKDILEARRHISWLTCRSRRLSLLRSLLIICRNIDSTCVAAWLGLLCRWLELKVKALKKWSHVSHDVIQ